jgi:predicted GIY-YIG superfamily endonuclease
VPRAKNANAREFYVYRLETNRVSFYVGIGRDKRACDRVRYIMSLINREQRGLPVKWHLSAIVIAKFLRPPNEAKVHYTAIGLTRRAALAKERSEIARLEERGAVLANIQNNPQRPKSADDIIRNVRARMSKRRAKA